MNVISKELTGAQFDLLKSVAKKVHKETMAKPAKPNCRKCYGTGRLGFVEGVKSLPYPCPCLRRKAK